MDRINNLSRSIYREIINDKESLRAIAMLLFVKHKCPSSVVANYSNYKLAKLTGLHQNTVKKRMNILANMELIDYCNYNTTHILFKNVRAKCSNVKLTNIDMTSVKSIEIGLMAMVVYEIQRTKNFVQQQIINSQNPILKKDDGENYRKFKKAKRFCDKRGLTEFKDNGISYNFIANKIGGSLRTVAKLIKHGVEQGMYKKTTHINYATTIKGGASSAVKMINAKFYFSTKKNNNIYCVSANTYSIA